MRTCSGGQAGGQAGEPVTQPHSGRFFVAYCLGNPYAPIAIGNLEMWSK